MDPSKQYLLSKITEAEVNSLPFAMADYEDQLSIDTICEHPFKLYDYRKLVSWAQEQCDVHKVEFISRPIKILDYFIWLTSNNIPNSGPARLAYVQGHAKARGYSRILLGRSTFEYWAMVTNGHGFWQVRAEHWEDEAITLTTPSAPDWSHNELTILAERIVNLFIQSTAAKNTGIRWVKVNNLSVPEHVHIINASDTIENYPMPVAARIVSPAMIYYGPGIHEWIDAMGDFSHIEELEHFIGVQSHR